MVYKFVLLSDEVDEFGCEIQIDSEATFMDLHDVILKSVGYTNDQITSFFVCDDDWEKEVEITQIQMDTASDVDSYVMDETKLYDLVNDEGQKLMFVFDYMNDRAFFMELKSIITNKELSKPICNISKGKAPAQLLDAIMEDPTMLIKAAAVFDEVEDFLDGEGFNEDELDGLSINDNYFEE